MKWIATTLCCLLSLCAYGQNRAAIFNLDMSQNYYHLKPADLLIHVREMPDHSLYTDSSGAFNYAKFEEAIKGKLDTQVNFNADFAFSMRDLKPGATYGISIRYKVPLDTFNKQYVYRYRALFQEVKLNNWTYQYSIRNNEPCRYDASLKNRNCPKCHRKDHVLPILYGLNVADPTSTESTYFVKGHEAGCEVTGCDPNWYCERDKLSF